MKTLPHSSAVGCLVPSHAASCDADLGVLMREADLTLVTGLLGVAMFAAFPWSVALRC